jgi:hypothetical protein
MDQTRAGASGFLRALGVALVVCAAAQVAVAQSSATGVGAAGGNALAVTRGPLPSETLRPALEVVRQAIAGTNVDRWRGSSAVRDEAEANLQSIQRDVQTTLPTLLAAADAAPNSAAKTLPAYRNVEALYDVLLRLEAAGQLAAPREQASALQQAVNQLNDGRRALGDQLQQDAEGQEGQVVRLQAALKAVPPPAPPPAPVACVPAPVKKKAKAASSSASH